MSAKARLKGPNVSHEHCIRFISSSVLAVLTESENENFPQKCFHKAQVTDASQLVEKLKGKLEKLFGLKKDVARPPARPDEYDRVAETELQLLSQLSRSSQSYTFNGRVPGVLKTNKPIETAETSNDNVKEVKKDGTASEVETGRFYILDEGSADENKEDSSRSPSPSMLTDYSLLKAISQSVELELEELIFSGENSREEIPDVKASDLGSDCSSMPSGQSNPFKRPRSPSLVTNVSEEIQHLQSQNLTQSTVDSGSYFSTPTSEEEPYRASGSWSQIINGAELDELSQISRRSNNGYREKSDCFSSQSSSSALSQNLPSSLESSSSAYGEKSAEPLHEPLPPGFFSFHVDTQDCVELDGYDEPFFLSEPGVGLDPEIFRAIMDSLN